MVKVRKSGRCSSFMIYIPDEMYMNALRAAQKRLKKQSRERASVEDLRHYLEHVSGRERLLLKIIKLMGHRACPSGSRKAFRRWLRSNK